MTLTFSLGWKEKEWNMREGRSPSHPAGPCPLPLLYQVWLIKGSYLNFIFWITVAKNVKQEININYAEMDPNNTVCPLCGSKLKSKYYLKYHIQEVHEGIKPYSCSMCDKRFAQRNKLKDHISNIHERIKPFKCSACDYKAGLKGNLTKHIDKVHEGRM